MKIKTSLKVELLLVAIIMLAGLLIRSINYELHLNFSADQGIFATNALEIYRERKLTLIGPASSFIVQGRKIFQSSVIYYMDLMFLLIGNFDPVNSSLAFTVFSTLMVFPLYFGMKWLSDKKKAILLSIIYSLVPFYVNYTRFLWNVNFQLALCPLLIFFLGLYQRTQKKKLLVLALTGILTGFLIQFHYQFVVITLALVLYLWIFKKLHLGSILLFIGGVVIGFSPMIIFEMRHDFYTLQTLYLFIANKTEFIKTNIGPGVLVPHYFLSISFVLLGLALAFIKLRLRPQHFSGLFIILLALDLYLYIPRPNSGFNMAKNWNYPAEARTHQLILKAGVRNFNVVNLAYNTVAEVQKYLLRKDGTNINFDDYTNNEYLFVITNKDFSNDPAYEVRTFTPSRTVSVWKINDYYWLQLLERTI